MFPLVKFVAVFGGIAASAQLASGVVRGVKELCRGRPVAGLMEVADGMAAPILNAVKEVSSLGHEVYVAVTGPWQEEPKELAPARQDRPCCQHENADEGGSLNGVAAVAAKG